MTHQNQGICLRHLVSVTLAALLAVSFPGKLYADECIITGRLTDDAGRPVPGVTVRIGESQRGSFSDSRGIFTVKLDTTQKQPLRITAVGFENQVIESGDLRCGDIGSIGLTPSMNLLQPVVVTATRSYRSLDGTTLPVTVVSDVEVRQSAPARLGELLAEQTGLQVVSQFGSGIQVQGFDPDYTMIMINGEPLVGRVGGTLDLNRIAVSNIRQIEIVKGPSSSLYGSEALAGVVNIITEQPDDALKLNGSVQGGSYGQFDANLGAGLGSDNIGVDVFVNHNRGDGYDLDPQTRLATLPKTWSTTARSSVAWANGKNVEFKIGASFFDEQQRNQDNFITSDRGRADVLYFSRQLDASVTPELRLKLAGLDQLSFRNHFSTFATDTYYRYDSDNVQFERSKFDQTYWKSEVVLNEMINPSHIVTAGVGYVRESVASDRFVAGTNYQSTGFLFLQHEWEPTESTTIVSGLRYDVHDQYENKLSPRLSLAWKPGDIKYRASVGTGFKAPDFRHLYLNFFNPAGAYTVLGSESAADEIGRLIASGRLRPEDLFLPLDDIASLNPEYSVAVNIGADLYRPTYSISVNMFNNNVSDLIEYTRAAVLGDGLTLFSYQNLNRVLLRGAELSGSYRVNPHFELGAGYQFLDSRDQDVYEDVKAGRIFRRDPSSGEVTRVRTSDYGGLLNRSRHSGNLRLNYDLTELGTGISLRAIYRGRYGFGDANGNGIIDAGNEYGKGHVMLNATVTQTVGNRFEVFGSALNLLNFTEADKLPTTPGRMFRLGIRFTHQNQ
jgi:outer membrane receptor for ferrienterochelin and colicins